MPETLSFILDLLSAPFFALLGVWIANRAAATRDESKYQRERRDLLRREHSDTLATLRVALVTMHPERISSDFKYYGVEEMESLFDTRHADLQKLHQPLARIAVTHGASLVQSAVDDFLEATLDLEMQAAMYSGMHMARQLSLDEKDPPSNIARAWEGDPVDVFEPRVREAYDEALASLDALTQAIGQPDDDIPRRSWITIRVTPMAKRDRGSN